MYKNFNIAAAFFIFFFAEFSIAHEEDEILGYWLTSQSIVLVSKFDSQL